MNPTVLEILESAEKNFSENSRIMANIAMVQLRKAIKQLKKNPDASAEFTEELFPPNES